MAEMILNRQLTGSISLVIKKGLAWFDQCFMMFLNVATGLDKTNF